MEHIDILQESSTNLKPRSLDALEVTLDLGPLTLDDITTESFDDLIARRGDESGNLFPLRKCRLVLQDGGRMQLANPYPGAREPAYLDLQEMLLRAAGFTDIVVKDTAGPVVVEAAKRAPVVEEQEYGMVIRELVTAEDVAASHVFSRDYYYYKDFNYDLEVARQFDLHADIFAVYDRHQQMIALARIAWRVPGYRCPFMYSVTESGDHYRVPRRCRRTGEVSAIYREGRDGVFAYKRLMEFLVYHVPPISLPDSVWTTYEVNDPYTGNLYKNKFLMEDMGVRLTYRDFGGKWILLCTDRIEELHRLHHSLFRG